MPTVDNLALLIGKQLIWGGEVIFGRRKYLDFLNYEGEKLLFSKFPF